MKKNKSDKIEFRGYPFYEITSYGYNFVFNKKTIIEAKNQGISEQNAYSSILGKYCGMLKRDKLIVKALVNNNIKKVYDIGGDRGGLAQLLKLDGIDVTVFEPRSDSVEYMKLHNIDCKEISVQELTKNFKDYISCGPETAIVCLNFTHAKWKNENEKKDFFELINKSGIKIFIFSWIGKMNNIFTNFEEDHSFNPNVKGYYFIQLLIYLFNKLRLSKFVRYFNFLKIETEYETMQRLLINKENKENN